MTQANYTNISFNSSNFFSGYVADNNIYTINGELIGVNLAKYQEVEQGLLKCKNRLIELGEIKVPKTQEEIIAEQTKLIETQQALLNEIMSKMKGQEDEQRATNELNELSTTEHKGQGEPSTRESLADNRPVKNKNKE
jgi:hypothetical protein